MERLLLEELVKGMTLELSTSGIFSVAEAPFTVEMRSTSAMLQAGIFTNSAPMRQLFAAVVKQRIGILRHQRRLIRDGRRRTQHRHEDAEGRLSSAVRARSKTMGCCCGGPMPFAA